MSLMSWLKQRALPRNAVLSPEEAMAHVRWLAAGENPFGVELLDCQVFAGAMISVTSDPAVGDSYGSLRHSNGSEYRGGSPKGARTCPCNLHYPHTGESHDGPLFKAEVMEDKWDIYLYDGPLYFARSWTGDLEYRAAIELQEGGATIRAVEARRELVEAQPAYPVAAVDYLIRSHLFRQPTPHPLPEGYGHDQAQRLALFSFSQYGRFGLFGAFGDTTVLRASESWSPDETTH